MKAHITQLDLLQKETEVRVACSVRGMALAGTQQGLCFQWSVSNPLGFFT